MLATPSTTEPPDRAAGQQKFTSMPSESGFMCVLPATKGRERRKALKKKNESVKCNSELPSNVLFKMKPRVLPNSLDLLFPHSLFFIVSLLKTVLVY